MSELKKSGNVSIHPFQPLHPDTRPELSESSDRNPVSTNPTLYKTLKRDSNLIIATIPEPAKKKSTIITAGLMMTNACLGTTIFTFAIKAKTFGDCKVKKVMIPLKPITLTMIAFHHRGK